MNVSHAEYAKMYGVYQKSLQQSKILARLEEIASTIDQFATTPMLDPLQFQPAGKINLG